MLISFIIPAYNAGAYIEDCLSSIYRNPVDESLYEVIAINDGSTDNTLQLLQRWAEAHRNMVVIDQPNSGVSKSRNRAIDIAKAEYVSFVDADDWIDEGCLPRIVDILQEREATDVLICTMYSAESRKPKYDWTSTYAETQAYSNTVLCEQAFFRGSVCGAFYKRERLQAYGIKFPLGVVNSEDLVFSTLCVTKPGVYQFGNIPFYYVRHTEGSASRKFDETRLVKMKTTLEVAHKLYEDASGVVEKKAFSFLKYRVLSQICIVATKCGLSYHGFSKIVDIRSYLPLDVDGMIQSRKMARLMNISPRLYYARKRLVHAIERLIFRIKWRNSETICLSLFVLGGYRWLL